MMRILFDELAKFELDDAVEFYELEVRGLGKKFKNEVKTGQHFSLPTERQWEYACRSGGELEKFSGGYGIAEDVAWYRKNSENKPCHVGLNQPNGLGLYDMTGNVWEWRLDGYDKDAYKRASSNQPNRLSDSHPRVLRGGSYFTKAADLRCPNRWSHDPNDRVRNVGFRLVMTPN